MTEHATMMDWSDVGSLASGSLGGPATCVPEPGLQSATSVTFVPFSGPRLFRQVVVEADERVYCLNGPLRVDLEYLPDNTVFASHRALPVHGYGKSFKEAIEAFSEMFDFQYRNLVECDESELTEGALERRARLQDVVRDIVE